MIGATGWDRISVGVAMSLVSCPECSSQLSDRAAQCPHCGASIEGKCPECESLRLEGDDSCSNCGYPFDISSAQNKSRELNSNEEVRPSGEPQHDAMEKSAALSSELITAYIGPKNADFYVQAFKRIERNHSNDSWNWPAFFMSIPWFFYRGMWGYALLYWFVSPFVIVFVAALVTGLLEGTDIDAVIILVYMAFAFLIVPIYANRLYYGHVKRKIDAVRKTAKTEPEQIAELKRVGGSGGLGIVVAIFFGVALIGILAATAIPAYQDYTIRAQVAEGLNLAGAAKAAVTEYYQSMGAAPLDNSHAGLEAASSIQSSYVSGIAVVEGRIDVTYGNNAHPRIQGLVLSITPFDQGTGTIAWSCGAVPPKIDPASDPFMKLGANYRSGSLARYPKYLPTLCR